MYKGYIIFLTESWLPIVSNLIDTIISFSIYDIEVNCINFTYNFNNDRIKTKTIKLNDTSFYNITMCKLISTINSNFDIALILDGDMIVTPEIDKIFNDNEERIKNFKCPLFAKHPHNPFDRWNHIIHRLTKEPPLMKWVYSNYLFTKEQKWFFQEALNYMTNVPYNERDFYYPVPEESVLNALLIKYKVDYDLGYNYFPNGMKCVIDYFLNENEEGKKHINECYLSYDCPVKFYAFHGHDIKDINYTKGVVQQLKLLKTK
jgi:alpha-N-acetylglucosamine transferase